MNQQTELAFFAGVGADEQPVFESLRIEIVDPSQHTVRLLKSPLFVRNLAAGDLIRVINPATAEFELLKRSGNLCIRVFRKQDIEALADLLVPGLEKLGGSLDLRNPRALVFSIHFSIGFKTIEEQLQSACERFADAVWYYGNVYDPADGTTPLLWWQEFESQE